MLLDFPVYLLELLPPGEAGRSTGFLHVPLLSAFTLIFEYLPSLAVNLGTRWLLKMVGFVILPHILLVNQY